MVLLLGFRCFGGRLEAKFGEFSSFPHSLDMLRIRIIGGLIAFVNAVLVLDCSFSILVRDWGPR